MPAYALVVPDVFEQGFNAFVQLANNPRIFPSVPLNPYDPATHIGLYEEWEGGYEYAAHISKLPEKGSDPTPQTKTERLFGPFTPLLNKPKENPSP